MSRIVVAVLMGLLPWFLVGSAHGACARSESIVRTGVVSQPLTIKEDYTSEELRALAGTMTQKPPHPILGFYAASTGYQFTVLPRPDSACGFDADVRLVSTKRVIEIAKDLGGSPCMMNAALRHYRLHEAGQTAALVDSARRLQTALRTFLDRNPSADRGRMELLVTGFMTKWLSAYEAGLHSVRENADSPANVAALVHACDL